MCSIYYWHIYYVLTYFKNHAVPHATIQIIIIDNTSTMQHSTLEHKYFSKTINWKPPVLYRSSKYLEICTYIIVQEQIVLILLYYQISDIMKYIT